MKVAEIHRCSGCDTEARGEPNSIPKGWKAASILTIALTLCEACYRTVGEESAQKAIVEAVRGLLLKPRAGDEVVLLVDGHRGKFKGRKGIVNGGGFGDTYGIRVPGERAPGESVEYVGPYSRSQFRLLRQPS